MSDVGKKTDETIAFSFGKQKFFKVYDVDEVFEILDKHGVDSYMFVDGNTGKGMYKETVPKQTYACCLHL